MSIIRDPSSNKGMKVNNEGQGVVRSIIESEIEHASINGDAYCWFSGDQDIDAGDTMLFIKNLGDTPLVLDRMNITGDNSAAGTWTIHLGKLTTTPTTINITGTNLNQRFSDEAAVHSVTDEALVADGSIVETIYLAILEFHHHDLTGIILEKGNYIQINQEIDNDTGAVAIYGHFENPS